MIQKTTGLIAAPPTPMDAGGELRLELVEKQAEMLARNGVAGAFVGGTTGEGLSLTVPERMDLAGRWVEAAPAGFRVIVHVGHTCLADSRTLAAHAVEIGAAAVGALPPLFFKPRGPEDLADYLARIASAAPDLPFYYYHIPSLSGVAFPMCELLPLAARQVPNFAGVKFTYEDLMDYAACLDLDGGRFDCLFGRDEILLPALALGARGAIGSTYNFAAPLYLRLIEAFEAGDLETARALQRSSAAMIGAARRTGAILAAFKQMMAMIGLDLGPVRPPLSPLDAGRVAQLSAELEALGFFEFCCR